MLNHISLSPPEPHLHPGVAAALRSSESAFILALLAVHQPAALQAALRLAPGSIASPQAPRPTNGDLRGAARPSGAPITSPDRQATLEQRDRRTLDLIRETPRRLSDLVPEAGCVTNTLRAALERRLQGEGSPELNISCERCDPLASRKAHSCCS
jgi:hypothetical protein